jgi:hypothetical protein
MTMAQYNYAIASWKLHIRACQQCWVRRYKSSSN